MAVEACVTKKMYASDSSDDDGPIVFKRRDSSRQNQLDSALKNPSTRPDKPSGKNLPDTSTSNDHASGNSKGKVIHASKPSSSNTVANQKSPSLSDKLSSLRPPASLSKMSPLKSLLPTSTASLVSHPKNVATAKVEMSKKEAIDKGVKPNKDVTIKEEKPKRELVLKEEKPKRELVLKEEKPSTSGSKTALQACLNKKRINDNSSDGQPAVFKRRDVSRQNQLDSALKDPSTRPDEPSGKHLPDTGISSDRASDNLKENMIHASKPSSSNPIENQKSPSVSGKVSSVRSPASPGKMFPLKSLLPTSAGSLVSPPEKDAIVMEETSKIETPIGEKPNKNVTIKKEIPKRDVAVKDEKLSTSDSEDDMPLSSRLSIGMKSANLANKGHDTSSKPTKGKSLDDSDDDKPLSSKFQLNPNTGASSSKLCKLDVDKPLTSKLQQNGSIKRDNQQNKASVIPAKRLGSDAFAGQSSSKKMKLSSTPVSVKDKQVSKKSDHEDKDDHIPISQRMKNSIPVKKSTPMKQSVTKDKSSLFNKDKKQIKKANNNLKYSVSSKASPASGDGQKWTTLVHNGVIFPPSYEPHRVKMLYDGRPVDLTPQQEEVATMYAVMLDSDYVQKEKFNENFFNDWKKLLGKNHTIRDLSKCDFTPIQQWHLREKERKKQMTTEEKKALKEEKLKQEEKYMWAILDGVKEKVGNFRVEPPGLFRGRGEHPKMGKLKKRIHPSDITINIGKDAPIPECPIPGEKWKEIKHDNTVTWLAFWNDPINPKEFKYVFLAASSTLKGQSDKEKYEKSRMLKNYIQGIRTAYKKDFASKDMTKRQIAVATYLIDRLALRAGNEKDDDEADTVGCCTLKVENVKPLPPNLLEFDFLGKDSIRYYKQFEADPLVYKAVEQFRKGKKGSDDLFDMLDTSKLNAHLKELMPGLTAKVFRTYNASITLDNMLVKALEDGEVAHKVCGYLEANKEVAIICNHQRSVSKSHSAQMERLTEKINELKDALSEFETDLSRAKKGKPPLNSSDGKRKRNLAPEAIEKKVGQTKAKIEKMERDMRTKEDMKEIALGTSRINYLDPRITVAWCKRNEVPIEKIFNKSLLAKFAWAMDADPDFRF